MRLPKYCLTALGLLGLLAGQGVGLWAQGKPDAKAPKATPQAPKAAAPAPAKAAGSAAAQQKKALVPAAKSPAKAAQAPAKAPAKAAAKAPAKVQAKAPAKAPGKLPAKAKAAPAAKKEAPAATQAKPAGPRRDPFESLLGRQRGPGGGEPERLPPGKAGLVVGSLRLDGIVRAPNGMLAVVSNPQQRVYFLRDGDQLYDGRVERISMEGVAFHEVGKDAFGKPVDRQVFKRLYPSSGEQP